MALDETLETLGRVAASFPEESEEAKAIETAAASLAFVLRQKTRADFEDFINNKNRPISGYELINLRMCGIDIPDELRTPEVMQLESEMDVIAAKLRDLR